jgi:ABC transporter substrate binding protein
MPRSCDWLGTSPCLSLADTRRAYARTAARTNFAMSGTKRRDFVTLLGGAAAAWPLAAHAQQDGQVRRIGVLMAHSESDPEFRDYLSAFRQALQKLGWIEGRNVRIETRWGALDDAEARQQSAKERDLFQLAATYVDRILWGAKPGELPVQAPVKYELIVNLKTAKALGLEVPPLLQQRADEVIE